MFWPYSYDKMLGVNPGKPVDSSYNNLAPFAYGKTEMKKIEAGESVFPHVFGTDSAGQVDLKGSAHKPQQQIYAGEQ